MRRILLKDLPVCLALLLLISAGCTAYQQKAHDEWMVKIERDTGLKPVQPPGTEGHYLGRDYRGYPILYTAKMGDVWGRYAARLTMGEIGREVGGIMAFLTGSYEWGPGAADSILDRLLAKAIGQPLSLTMILKHNKKNVPRLDVLSNYSNIEPEKKLTRREKVGWGAGYIYSDDAGYADRVAANTALMERLSELRGEYIRVDEEAVTLFWAGQETEYSAMIDDHGGYIEMLNAFMADLADLADLADAIPERPAEQ